MPTITPEEEALIQRALKGVRDGRFPNMAIAARHFDCNYDVLRARSRGIQGNWSKGGKNKRLVDEEVGMRILYNIDPIIYNYNIMGLTPLFDIIICTGPTRDISTHYSQPESRDF
jgi:hypothetical protein